MPEMTKQSETKNIPKLRFPGFSGEWEEKKLGNVCDFRQGVQVDLDLQLKDEKDGYTRFLRIENYTQHSQDFRFIPKNSPKNKEVSIDDIVVVRYGATAGFISRGFAGILANNLFSIRPQKKDEIVTDFLFRILKQEKVFQYLQSAMSGGAMPALSFSMMNPIKIKLPPLSEQQKIAEFLGSVDEWIENLRKQKEELEAYKKGIMQKIFSQEVRFKDDNGNDFPEWEEKKLEEIAEFMKGRGISKDNLVNGGKNKCILYGELYTKYNEMIREIKSSTNIPGKDSLLSRAGDVLVPSSGETALDIVTVSCIKEENVLLGGDLNVIRFKEQDGTFFAYYLSNFQNKNIARLAQGNSVVHLYSSHLKTLKIDIPSLIEQQKIAEFLISLDNLINSKQQQITQTEEWKKGLMRELFA